MANIFKRLNPLGSRTPTSNRIAAPDIAIQSPSTTAADSAVRGEQDGDDDDDSLPDNPLDAFASPSRLASGTMSIQAEAKTGVATGLTAGGGHLKPPTGKRTTGMIRPKRASELAPDGSQAAFNAAAGPDPEFSQTQQPPVGPIPPDGEGDAVDESTQESSSRQVHNQLAPSKANAKAGRKVVPKPARAGAISFEPTGIVPPAVESSREGPPTGAETSQSSSAAAARHGGKRARQASGDPATGARSGPSSRAEKRALVRPKVAKPQKRRKAPVERTPELEEDGEGQEDAEGEDEEAAGERDQEGSQVVKIPTMKEFGDDKLYKSFRQCAIQYVDADGKEVEQLISVGDCIFVVNNESVGPDQEVDRDDYWLAKIGQIRAGVDPDNVGTQTSPGRKIVDTGIFLRVAWFWRLRDFGGTDKGSSAIRKTLQGLGFRAGVEKSATKHWRLQDRELIATQDEDIIPLDSVAGLADVLAFDDAALEPGDVYRPIRPKQSSRDDVSPAKVGISHFYHRLQWDAERSRAKSKQLMPWVPRLCPHCVCKKHYDPAHRMVFCPRDKTWFHAACLSARRATRPVGAAPAPARKNQVTFADESDHSGSEAGQDEDDDGGRRGGSPGKRKRPSGDADIPSPAKKRAKTSNEESGAAGNKSSRVPASLSLLAQRSITRGGSGGTLAGNFALVTRAKALVEALEQGKEEPAGWKDKIGLGKWEADSEWVRPYTEVVGKGKKYTAKRKGGQGPADAGNAEELKDGHEWVCPTCGDGI